MSALRIAFLGGTRFIGPAGVRACLARGHAVEVWHRGTHPNATEARSRIVDRNDGAAIRRAATDMHPDVVVDTRAMTRRDARTAALALAGASVRNVVVLSSQDVYAQFQRLNGLVTASPLLDAIDESAPLGAEYPFRGMESADRDPDYDKQHVEQVYRDATESGAIDAATVLRVPATYGEGDPARRFGGIVDALDAADTAHVTLSRQAGGTFRFTHAHVADVAHAIALACERPHPFEIFNVGEAITPTTSERAEKLAHALGMALTWVEDAPALPDALSHLGEMPNDIVTSSARIRAALGFAEVTDEPTRLADIISAARQSRTT